MNKAEYQNIFNLEETHWWYVGMRRISEVLLQPVFDKFGKKPTMLDAGCGTGGILLYFQKSAQVYGIDASEDALKFCRQNGLKNVEKATVEKLPHKDEAFDLVVSFDVLCHEWVKSDQKAFEEFNRVLKPGGYLLVRLPAYDWLKASHDKFVQTKHRYNAAELKEKVEKASFVVDRITYANMFLFPIVLLKRLIEKLQAKGGHSDVGTVSPLVNKLFQNVLYLEALIISKVNLPFGLTVSVLCHKSIK